LLAGSEEKKMAGDGKMEPKLWACLLALAPTLRPGAVLDAGANDGTTSALLWQHLRPRPLVSVEPIQANVRALRAKLANASAATVIHGGLGAHARVDSYPARLDAGGAGLKTQTGRLGSYAWQAQVRDARVPFRVHTIDALFRRGPPLALAHLDVEGAEEDALRGAAATLALDRPVLTVETFPKHNATRHARLVRLLREEQGYALYLVDEVCGRPRDCRNLIALPREHPNATAGGALRCRGVAPLRA
jgi:FkbM family methyltransferase